MAITKHIDDIKCVGTRKNVVLFLQTLERVFGKPKYHEGTLKNTGIEHVARPDGSIAVSQTSYIQGIQPMNISNLQGKCPEDEVSADIASEYNSVLGAIAYAMLTQPASSYLCCRKSA